MLKINQFIKFKSLTKSLGVSPGPLGSGTGLRSDEMKFPRKFPQNKILIRLNHAKSKKRSKKPVKQCEIETLFKIDPRVRLFRRVVNVSKSDGFNLGIDFSRPCSRHTNLSRRYVVQNDQFLGGLLRRFFLILMP